MKYLIYNQATLEPIEITETPSGTYLYLDLDVVINDITLVKDYNNNIHISTTDEQYNQFLMLSAKQRIEKEVGCILDLVLDGNNNITALQRLLFRLFLHVTGAKTMTTEYISEYNTKLLSYINGVDVNTIVEPMDSMSGSMMADIIAKKQAIEVIMQQEYYTKKRS